MESGSCSPQAPAVIALPSSADNESVSTSGQSGSGEEPAAAASRATASTEEPVASTSGLNAGPSTSYSGPRPSTSTAGTSRGNPNPDDVCSICQELLTTTSKCQLMPCTHRYHYTCITTWFGNLGRATKTCPMCRSATRSVRYNFISDSQYVEQSLQTRRNRRVAPRQVIIQPLANGSFTTIRRPVARNGRRMEMPPPQWMQGQEFTPVEVAVTPDISIYGMHPIPTVELVSRASEVQLVRAASAGRAEQVIASIQPMHVYVLAMDQLTFPNEYFVRDIQETHQLAPSVNLFTNAWRSAYRTNSRTTTASASLASGSGAQVSPVTRTIPTRAVPHPSVTAVPITSTAAAAAVAAISGPSEPTTSRSRAASRNVSRPVDVVVDMGPTNRNRSAANASPSERSYSSDDRPSRSPADAEADESTSFVQVPRRRTHVVTTGRRRRRPPSSSSSDSSVSDQSVPRRRRRVPVGANRNRRRPPTRSGARRAATTGRSGGRQSRTRGSVARRRVAPPNRRSRVQSTRRRGPMRRTRPRQSYVDFVNRVRHPILAARRQRAQNRHLSSGPDPDYDPSRDS